MMPIQRVWAAIIATVTLFGWAHMGGDLPVDTVTPTVYVHKVEGAPTPPVLSFMASTPAEVATGAVRRTQQHEVVTSAPTTTIPTWTPGVCESFRPFFTEAAGEFFIDHGVLNRETRCDLDLLNEATGDSGPCQINPIHNKPGWFGGREFGDGGWLLELHGLTARYDLDNHEWLAACQTLFDVCDRGPWQPPYSCAGRPL